MTVSKQELQEISIELRMAGYLNTNLPNDWVDNDACLTATDPHGSRKYDMDLV